LGEAHQRVAMRILAYSLRVHSLDCKSHAAV
jgi:hypothetical protein